MLVQCPKCRTTYKVSDDVLSGAAPAFRCSRCKHTFELETGENREPSSEAAQPEPPVEPPSAADELSLPFGLKSDAKPALSEPDQEHLSSQRSMENAAKEKQEQTEWAISPSPVGEEKPFVFSERDAAKTDPVPELKDDDPVFRKLEFDDPEPNSNNITAISPYLDQHASIKPFVTLLSFLVIGFALLAAISYARPETPEAVLKKIPLIGATVLKNNHLKQGILIKSLSTGYQTIQGNREVFLVSGVAVNQNPVVVREIQLTGTIYNEAGKEIERQMIWAGNTLSPKIIRGMTLEDIPQLQELKPLKSFELPPGDFVPFTIVFLKSVKNAKQFTCEVASAAGEV